LTSTQFLGLNTPNAFTAHPRLGPAQRPRCPPGSATRRH
jgi:hypothetical protein